MAKISTCATPGPPTVSVNHVMIGVTYETIARGKLVSGVTLLAVPTIMYGGITLLGLLTKGMAGVAPGQRALDETQWALWRAGHAHGGVWVLLSLVMQVLIDSTRLSTPLMWLARLSAPVVAVTVSGGFFGVAFFPQFRWLLSCGGLSLCVAVVLTGVGLLSNLRAPDTTTSHRLQKATW